MSLVDHYHAEHKARRQRIEARAYKPPQVQIVPEPEKEIDVLRVLLAPEPEVAEPKIERLPVGVEDIKRAVCGKFCISHEQIISPSKEKKVTFPRQIAIWLCRQHKPKLSLHHLGKQFGGRDHTTILHAIQKIGGLVLSDWTFAYEVAEIEATL